MHHVALAALYDVAVEGVLEVLLADLVALEVRDRLAVRCDSDRSEAKDKPLLVVGAQLAELDLRQMRPPSSGLTGPLCG
jgi:hypothetical protein